MDNEVQSSAKIPLHVLRRMLPHMTASDLRAIPVANLPDEIPLELLENTPVELRRVLEDKSLEIGSRQISRWTREARRYGAHAAVAIELADHRLPAYTAERFAERVATVEQEWQEIDTRRAEAVRGFSARLDELADDFADVMHDSGRLLAAIGHLDRAVADHGRVDRLSEARHRLASDLERIEAVLASYHMLRLRVAREEMRRKREDIEAGLFDEKQLQEKLDVVQRRLQRAQSLLRRTLRPTTAQREREHLQQRIIDLLRERESREWLIAEQDMTRWLDTVVDSSLYVESARQEQVLRDGRLALYQLLTYFCRQQETSAKQVAQNPFLQLDPEQAIQYLLISERFILSYFARKRSDLTRWLGGAAQDKLAELDRLQQEILSEYRRQRGR